MTVNIQEKELYDCICEASDLVLKYFKKGQKTSAEVTEKADGSFVTQADYLSNQLIIEYLKRTYPDIPIISEEDENLSDTINTIDSDGAYFLIDPLDSTASFIRGHEEFAINIGLIEKGRAIMGMLAAPAKNEYWYGHVTQGKYWYYNRMTKRSAPFGRMSAKSPLMLGVSSSQSRDDILLNWLGDHDTLPIQQVNSAIKFGQIADGRLDIYPRFIGSMAWDTGAGQAIIEAAGGRVFSMSSQPLANVSQEMPLTYHPLKRTNPKFSAFSAFAVNKLSL